MTIVPLELGAIVVVVGWVNATPASSASLRALTVRPAVGTNDATELTVQLTGPGGRSHETGKVSCE